MNYYSEIEAFSISVLDNLNEEVFENSEMKNDQLEFLCGLIRDYKPHKIVEVGVAAGATTCIILSCLDFLKIDAEVFSIDLCSQLWRDHSKTTGYIATDYLERIDTGAKHRLILGKYLPECIDDIGGNIDFVILDTVHHLPGEMLDFLAILPYLKNGATVVLHDVSLQHNNSVNDPYSYVNQVLFTTVTAQKYLNYEEGYPNIAAFTINAETRHTIQDVFSALTITWSCFPCDDEISLYRSLYKKHYTENECLLFDQAVMLNKATERKVDMYLREYFVTMGCSLFAGYKHILLYGAGNRGRCLRKAINEINGDEIISKIEFLVSSIEEAKAKGCLDWASLGYAKEDTLIVLAADSEEIRQRLANSNWNWLAIPGSIWHKLERIYA